jgi:hypothetical protein
MILGWQGRRGRSAKPRLRLVRPPRAGRVPTGRPGRGEIAVRSLGPAPPGCPRLFQEGPSRARSLSGAAEAIAAPNWSMESGARPKVSDKTPQGVCFLGVSTRDGWRGFSRGGKAAHSRQAEGVGVVDLATFKAGAQESTRGGVGSAACTSGPRDVGGILVQDWEALKESIPNHRFKIPNGYEA